MGEMIHNSGKDLLTISVLYMLPFTQLYELIEQTTKRVQEEEEGTNRKSEQLCPKQLDTVTTMRIDAVSPSSNDQSTDSPELQVADCTSTTTNDGGSLYLASWGVLGMVG